MTAQKECCSFMEFVNEVDNHPRELTIRSRTLHVTEALDENGRVVFAYKNEEKHQ